MPREAITNTSYYKIDEIHEILVNKWTKQLLGELILAKVVHDCFHKLNVTSCQIYHAIERLESSVS